MTRIPRRQFVIFRNEILRLSTLWKMSGWEFEFLHENPSVEGAVASEWCNVEQRRVVFRLAKEYAYAKVTDADVRDFARHELTHVLTEPLLTLADRRYATAHQLDQAGHEVLQRLMLLLPR